MTPTLLRQVAGVVLTLGVLAGAAGCGSDDGSADSERLVLSPPSEGASHTHAPGQSDATPIGDGTAPAAGGYHLSDVTLPRRSTGPGPLTFRILDEADTPVTDLVEEQTKLLHLYVVRDDDAVFRHLHPAMDTDGTWRTQVDLGAPGDYRVIAEFHVTGDEQPVVLGARVTVPGDWEAQAIPTGSEAATADDGVVRVRVDGTGSVGSDGRLTFVVSDLEDRPLQLGSYLGTTAHLTGFAVVASGLGGFVHVHPYGAPEQTSTGTELVVHTAFTAAGRYRFFVQVRVDGLLHTVPVTVEVAG